MYRILALIEDRDVHQQLRSWLSSTFILADATGEDPLEQVFDLCIVDEPALVRWKPQIEGRKRAEYPVSLPLLLLTTREAIQNDLWQQWHPADDFMTFPLDSGELRTRVSLLLKNRRSSMAIDAERRQTTSLLRRREEQVRFIIQNMPVMLNAWGRNQTFVFWNRECERVTGYSAGEIVDNPRAMELLYPDSRYRDSLLADWSANPGNYRGVESSVTAKDGSVKTIAWSSISDQFPILDWATWGIGVDVTDRNVAQSAERDARNLAEALRDTATALTGSLHLNDVVDRILSNVGRVVPHDAANFMLLEGDRVDIIRSRGYDTVGLTESVTAVEVRLTDAAVLRQMVESRQPILVPDIRSSQLNDAPGLGQIQAYLGVPICWQDEVIGFINLNSTSSGFFTQEDADRLRMFAEQAAVAIQNARLYGQAGLLAAYEERQQLARDLHDSLTQSLFSATVISEALPRQIDSRPEVVKDRLILLHRLLRGTLAETRTLLLELHPNDIVKMEIGLLLKQLIESAQSRRNIWVESEIANQPQLDITVKKALYRIAQEAINNVLRHSHASRAELSFLARDGRIALSVSDNGRGFTMAQEASLNTGLGIMHNCARTIGAELTIRSEAGLGTKITVIWQEGQENTRS